MAELVLYLKDRELSRHPIGGAVVRIGRDPSNELVIDNVGISRHHATLMFDGRSFFVRDEGSQNGVFVNGQRIEVQAIGDGDLIQLGKFALRFDRGHDDLSALLADQNARLSLGGARDPQRTMALEPEEVVKLMGQAPPSGRPPSGASAGPPTQKQPPPAAFTEPSSAQGDNTLLILVTGLMLVVLIGVIGYLALIR